MQLALWTYEGPPHVGAMRIAASLEGVHLVLHAPQGDTYADLTFTMIERRASRPPVTWTTFQARDLGTDTADLFKRTVAEAAERHRPDLMMVGATCTAELLQDDPAGLAARAGLPMPVVGLDLPSYSKKENWGAAETFLKLVKTLCAGAALKPGETRAPRAPGARPRCNILGPTSLGFRNRDDLVEIRRLLDLIGVDVAVVAPLGARPADLARLGEADFNVTLYPETAMSTALWLKRAFAQPTTTTIPLGVVATRAFIREVATLAGLDPARALAETSRLPWWSRSVDATYLTGKRVFVFGDATHAVAAAAVAKREFGFDVVGLGTYSREFAREVRAAAEGYGLTALIADDYLEVEAAIAAAEPDLVLGTQMERHVAKKLGLPCAVISAPIHVQDFPARAMPQMGFEGADALFDAWVHPLMMGLEEHLLGLFREDREFGLRPSHLGHAAVPAPAPVVAAPTAEVAKALGVPSADPIAAPLAPGWTAEAEAELKKIPFFVRGKARRNTERFAQERGVGAITIHTLYDAKAHFSR